VTEVEDGRAAGAAAAGADAIILDVVMPTMDGLDLDADDYMTKPSSPRELATRVKVRRRRPRLAGEVASTLQAGLLTVDRPRRQCPWGDQAVQLTVLELAIVAAPASVPGRVFVRGILVEWAWGPGHSVSDRTVDSHVRRIRSKLRAASGDPIETVHGLGYRLQGWRGWPPLDRPRLHGPTTTGIGRSSQW
jgi:two-component system OmpR family response regulator